MIGPAYRQCVAGLLLFGLTGCSFVPRSRLEDCRKLSQTLEADKARLTDSVLSLRARNRDLSLRADDDARRLRIKTEENEQLLSSVHRYQEERDQLVSDFEKIKRLVRSSSSPFSANMENHFKSFAEGRPGTRFDEATGSLCLSTEMLFERGTDQLKPSSRAALQELGSLLREVEQPEVHLLVASYSARTQASDPSVQKASLGEEAGGVSGHLSLDRATRVREILAREGNLDPAWIDAAAYDTGESPSPSDRLGARWIEIRVGQSAG